MKTLCRTSILIILLIGCNDQEKRLTECTLLINSGKSKDAIIKLSEMIRQDSLNPKLYYFRAVAKDSLQEFEEAIRDFDMALTLDTTFVEAYYLRARTNQARGANKEAIADFTKAYSLLKPNWKPFDHNFDSLNLRYEIHIFRGEGYSSLEDYSIGIGDYQRALDVNSSAIAEYKAALAFEPYHSGTWCLLGNAYKRSGKTEEALKAYNEALSHNPKNQVVLLNMGLLYFSNKEYKKAIEFYNKAIQSDSTSALAFRYRSQLWRFLGDLQSALADKDKVVKFAPNDPESYMSRAKLLNEMKRFKECIADIDKVLEFDEYSYDANRMLADLNQKHTKDYRKAIGYLDKILMKNEVPEIYYERGLLKLQLQEDGCPDIRKAGQLGFMKAFEVIRKLCN